LAHGVRALHVRRLTILATILAYVQISLGAAVRVSGSGLGCANDWPLCRGRVIPPATLQAWVEYSHRTVGSVDGLLLMATVLLGWLTFRHSNRPVMWLVTAAAGIIVVEGLLGALVVFHDLAGFLVVAHLAVALLLIGLLITAVVLSATPSAPPTDRRVPRLTAAAVIVSFILLLSGATVVATGADEVCKSWPFCGGAALHAGTGLSIFTVTHRTLAGLAGAFLLATTVFVLLRQPKGSLLRAAALVTLILIVSEVGVGYPTAVTNGVAWVEGLHVAVAAAVWCGVVAMAGLANRARIENAALLR
jgi:heme a synthase